MENFEELQKRLEELDIPKYSTKNEPEIKKKFSELEERELKRIKIDILRTLEEVERKEKKLKDVRSIVKHIFGVAAGVSVGIIAYNSFAPIEVLDFFFTSLAHDIYSKATPEQIEMAGKMLAKLTQAAILGVPSYFLGRWLGGEVVDEEVKIGKYSKEDLKVYNRIIEEIIFRKYDQ